ncbi:MAG: 16S rRNA (adenine(1518)-N(6)/adenine(1519)-N(6))-dimethyltransferase RsmA [Rhodospirillales bacterium]
MNDPKLPPLREVIARFGLAARRKLGQHFLLDGNLTDRIARAAGDLKASTIFEIGPGPGGLTRSLLRAGAGHVVAIERDERCINALQELVAAFPGRLQIVEGDALRTDLATLGPAPRRIVANLPYNISTVLLLGWLERIDDFASLTLMFQKEVAERLVAKPRTKDYGRLSVIAQFHCTVRPLFDISASAFVPPPKVTSTVVELLPRADRPRDIDAKTLSAVTASAFGQRRKMLRAALRTLTPHAEALLERAGIVPTARAEELSVDQFCVLTRVWKEFSPPA